MSQTTQYYVKGMKCNGCVTNANKALSQVPGFESAQFDLQQGTAQVQGDLDPQAVCQALAGAGYPAVVKSG